MPAFDTQVQNLTFPATRSAINNALLTIVTGGSSNAAPANPSPFQRWTDTNFSPPIIRERNSGNSIWIPVAKADTTNWGFVAADSAVLTNTPIAPTAPPGTNTTQIATCAYVRSEMANHDGWQIPTLVGGWSAPTPVQYRKNRYGHTEMRGLALKTGPALSEVLFNLPAGYRPTQLCHWPSSVSSAHSIPASIYIEPSGDVRFYALTTATLTGQIFTMALNFSFPTA